MLGELRSVVVGNFPQIVSWLGAVASALFFWMTNRRNAAVFAFQRRSLQPVVILRHDTKGQTSFLENLGAGPAIDIVMAREELPPAEEKMSESRFEAQGRRWVSPHYLGSRGSRTGEENWRLEDAGPRSGRTYGIWYSDIYGECHFTLVVNGATSFSNDVKRPSLSLHELPTPYPLNGSFRIV